MQTKEAITQRIREKHGQVLEMFLCGKKVRHPWDTLSYKTGPGLSGYERQINAEKLILSNTFTTNGMQFSVNAFNTARPLLCPGKPPVLNKAEELTPKSIIGIDLGERFTIAAVSVQVGDDKIKTYLKSRNAFMQPYKRFQWWLQGKKAERNIHESESELEGSSSWNLDIFKNYREKRLGTVGLKVDKFYNHLGDKVSASFKYKKWQMKVCLLLTFYTG